MRAAHNSKLNIQNSTLSMSEHLTKDAIDLSTLSIPRLFGRYFLPTLFGMISISAMCAIDGIFVGHAVGADDIGAINICVPIMMLATGLGLMMGAGCSAKAASGSRSPSPNCSPRRASRRMRRCGDSLGAPPKDTTSAQLVSVLSS